MIISTSGLYPYVQSELNASTIYLVSKKDGSEHANYTYEEIMDAINSVAAGSSRIMEKAIENNNTAILLVVVIAAVAGISVGGFFLFKKKREN